MQYPPGMTLYGYEQPTRIIHHESILNTCMCKKITHLKQKISWSSITWPQSHSWRVIFLPIEEELLNVAFLLNMCKKSTLRVLFNWLTFSQKPFSSVKKFTLESTFFTLHVLFNWLTFYQSSFLLGKKNYTGE